MSLPLDAESWLKRQWFAPSRAGVRPRAHAGFALINALLLLAIMTLLLSISITYTNNSLKASRSVKYDTQAYNMARAGIVDAINYFKAQQSQPVQTFAPMPNPANPIMAVTNDPYKIDPGGSSGEPGLGIVQELCLDPATNIYGRYEVGKVTRLDKDPKGVPRNYYIWDSTNGWVSISNINQASSNTYEGVVDVSNLYGYKSGSGLVWRIYSHGYVYRRDPSVIPGTSKQLFCDSPNQVLEQSTLVTEIRRLNLQDFVTAMYAKNGGQVTFNNSNNLMVNAPNAWCLLFNGPVPTPNPGAQPNSFTGQSKSYGNNGNSLLDWTSVFGVDNANTLASMADLSVTDISQLPTSLPNMALTYIQPASGTADFTQARPLNGGGILVVNGNLILDSGSASSFSGYIYVNGNYTQDSPSDVTGEIVTTGSLTMNAPSDKATVEYNQDLINQIRTVLGQYREQRSAIKTIRFDSTPPSL